MSAAPHAALSGISTVTPIVNGVDRETLSVTEHASETTLGGVAAETSALNENVVPFTGNTCVADPPIGVRSHDTVKAVEVGF